MRARQLMVAIAIATVFGATPAFGEEGEDVAIGGKNLAPDAVTEIGGPTIRVCHKVTAHSDQRVAVALIHEALHNARLFEYPHDRAAMLSGEINNMVMQKCDLR